MNKKFLMPAMYVLCLGISIGLIGCARSGDRSESPQRVDQMAIPANLSIAQLATPANLSISVAGRLMTVTWDAVDNASGYIITTSSTACGSGNRIVNTATGTATSHAGTATNSGTAENGITNRGNGFVTFTSATSFTIWLMPEAGSETNVMATSLSANIMAVGDGVAYTDSERSATVTLAKADYGPAN